MRRALAPLLLLVAILVGFNAGQEWIRTEKRNIHTVDDAIQRFEKFLWPPWVPLLTYVSHDSDEHLFFEYSRLIFGEPADLAYIADQQGGDLGAQLSALRELVARKPGWKLPYRDLMIGFPPLSVAMILLPRLLVSTLPGYRIGFGALACGLYLLAWLCALRVARRLGSDVDARTLWWRAVLVTLALGSILARRLDALPALCTLGALDALMGRRPYRAAVLIAAGAAAKLYPLLLLPPLSALLWGLGGDARRRIYRLVGGLGALVAVSALVLFSLLGTAWVPLTLSLAVYGDRPIQLESTLGGVLLAFEGKAGIVNSYSSLNLRAPSWLSTAWQAVMVLALGGVTVLAARWARRHRGLDAAAEARAIARWTAAALLVILATSKVLSPQYFIWCLPLLVLLPGASGVRVYRGLVVLLAMSQLLYPILSDLLFLAMPGMVALLLLRNALLIALAIFTVKLALDGDRATTATSPAG